MTAAGLDFADLEGRVDAALAALTRPSSPAGAGSDELSFATAAASPEQVMLVALVALVRAVDDPDAALDFSAGSASEGTLAELRRDSAAFMRRVWRDLSHLAVVDTGGEGQLRAHTRIGWGGDTVTVLAADLDGAGLRAHGAAVRAAVLASLRRIRLLTTVAKAASKLAAILSSPAGALMALPVACKLVRDIDEQWRTTDPEPGPEGASSWQ